MTAELDLTLLARALPFNERGRILREIPEVEFHGYLASVLRTMQPAAIVEVTHGPEERGKDVVVLNSDALQDHVYAFVVKRGDMRAKTAGDVDELLEEIEASHARRPTRVTREILSQIRQAAAHPAELKATLRALRVDKVFVVLVGEISLSVRERLLKEVQPLAEIWALGEIVEKFTAHYPQVFFDGGAIDFLDQRIAQLENDSLLSKKGRTLTECFVEPFVSPINRGARFDDTQYALHLASSRSKLSTFYQKVESGGRFLLLGDPGSGKSKALAKICLDRYRAALVSLTRLNSSTSGTIARIPVLLPAARLAGPTTVALEDLIPTELQSRFSVSAILVDGLDEVASAARAEALESAVALADAAGAGLLVSSRKLALLSDASTRFQLYELMPLQMGQAIKMMEKLAGEASNHPALEEGLKKVGSQITLNPLSVIMLVELVSERKEVPASIGELYERYVDTAVGRWDSERGIASLFEYQVKKNFLATMAHDLFLQHDRMEVPRVEFDQFLVDYAATYGWEESELATFVLEIERSGIFTVTDEVFFRHRSFLDYFAGSYISENREQFEDIDKLISQLYYSDLWSESAFFYVAVRRKLSKSLLEEIAIADKSAPFAHWNKVLSGRLMQAGWHSTTAIKQQGIGVVLDSIDSAREEYKALLGDSLRHVPLVYIDVMMMMMVDWSIGSVFLRSEAEAALKASQQKPIADAQHARQELSLLWSIQSSLDSDNLEHYSTALAKRIAVAPLAPSDEAGLLALAGVIGKRNRAVLKTVRRRLTSLKKSDPMAFKSVLQSRRRLPGS